MLNVAQLKKDFPIFATDQELVYLDSTATSLKPQNVLNKLHQYYAEYSANIVRGVYKISEKATAEYESTRQVVADFISSPESSQVIFTRNATEALNLVMASWGRNNINEGDEIVTTIMEHHSNFVPWQKLAREKRAVFKIVNLTKDGLLDMEGVVSSKTKVLALAYVSNVLGTINPIKEVIAEARTINPDVIVIVDAAQAAPHLPINVTELDCDFLVFSSHKMLGPTGVGVLWGKKELLEKMPPYQFGGEMISEVTRDKTTYAPLPHKFEAGTPHIAGVIAFKAAIEYLKSIGLELIHTHERALAAYAIQRLKEKFPDQIGIVGEGNGLVRGGIVAFQFGSYHPHDVAQILDTENIAVRAGHHCAMPLHRELGLAASTRASFYLYNQEEDVEKLLGGLVTVQKLLKK